MLAAGIAELGIGKLPWSARSSSSGSASRSCAGPRAPTGPISVTLSSPPKPAHGSPRPRGEDPARRGHVDDLDAALGALLPWSLRRRLDAEAPTHYLAPTGNRHAIDYEGPGAPALHIRVQELFGLDEHPAIANGRLALTLHLLSPAHRPIQITRDLPGFWSGSWGAVKAEMRGRYPRHSWPDDPAQAPPTARAKPRGS